MIRVRLVLLAAPKPNAKRGTFILIAVVVTGVYLGYGALFTGHHDALVRGQQQHCQVARDDVPGVNAAHDAGRCNGRPLQSRARPRRGDRAVNAVGSNGVLTADHGHREGTGEIVGVVY